MEKTTVGSNQELSVSVLCQGTDHFGSRIDYDTSCAILDRYVAAGGNFLDTANCYAIWIKGAQGGESETLLGKWMKERKNRNSLVIATKLGVPYQDVPPESGQPSTTPMSVPHVLFPRAVHRVAPSVLSFSPPACGCG